MPGLFVRRTVAPLAPAARCLPACSEALPSRLRRVNRRRAASTVRGGADGARRSWTIRESRLLDLALRPGCTPTPGRSVWTLLPPTISAPSGRAAVVRAPADGIRHRDVVADADLVTPPRTSSSRRVATPLVGGAGATTRRSTVVRPGRLHGPGGADARDRARSVRTSVVVTRQHPAATGRGFWAVDDDQRAGAPRARAGVTAAPTSCSQTDGGQLRALTVQQTHALVGRRRRDLAGAAVARREAHGPMLAQFAASTDDTHVVVRGGDGATLFPFEQIRRLGS